MPVLADMVWDTPAGFLVERSAVWGVLLAWWEMCAIAVGETSTFQEVPFGGYRVVIGINPSFWTHTSSAWTHDQVITNLYALAPGSSTPISVGTVRRGYTFVPQLLQYVLTVSCIPNGSVGAWYRFPPATENAGSLLFPAQIPPQFYTVPDPPGVLFPLPHC